MRDTTQVSFSFETIDVRHEPLVQLWHSLALAIGLSEQVTQFEEQVTEVAKTKNTKFTALTRN